MVNDTMSYAGISDLSGFDIDEVDGGSNEGVGYYGAAALAGAGVAAAVGLEPVALCLVGFSIGCELLAAS